MWAATGDVRFKERADYIVNELKAVQDKHGDGYLGALADGREAFAEVAKGNIRSGQLRPQRPVVALVHAAQDVSPACATRIATPAIARRSTSR